MNADPLVTEADVRAAALHDPGAELELRAEFTPAAAKLADTLRAVALGTSEGGYECGCAAAYEIPFEVLYQMPWTVGPVLAGVTLSPPEGPWPDFGRTEAPIDWPSLIDAHPDDMTWDHEQLKANSGPDTGDIGTAYRLLLARGCQPRLDVSLWLAPDGRIAIEPLYLGADPAALDDELKARVEDILSASGRPREWLNADGVPGWWKLEA